MGLSFHNLGVIFGLALGPGGHLMAVQTAEKHFVYEKAVVMVTVNTCLFIRAAKFNTRNDSVSIFPPSSQIKTRKNTF